MASSSLTFEELLIYFKEKGGVVKNREVVRHFREYLTDPTSKDDARIKFKQYINQLAQTKIENNEKVLVLKTKYIKTLGAPTSPLPSPSPSYSSTSLYSPQYDARITVALPLSPSPSLPDFSPRSLSSPRQPPPYRPPPPVMSPSMSSDNISLYSVASNDENTPQAPPRRRSTDKLKSALEESTPVKHEVLSEITDNVDDKHTISVKERTQKFNRMASYEEESSPRQPKSAEKRKGNKGADEDDGASVKSIDHKKKVGWYVTASKGDFMELLKLAKDEPRLANKKDPFTAYTVLHWGAKHGNADIIKTFAGKYKVDVNGKTNGGYTPLHIAAQFGHKIIYDLLVTVYSADPAIRDYSGKLAEYYLLDKQEKGGNNNIRKIKGRKKQSEKDLGFLRIGSLNVRVKKTTEAFSNFLGVGGGVSPIEVANEKMHKGWGSADNVNEDEVMGAPKGYVSKKKVKRITESGQNSTPGTPKQAFRSMNPRHFTNDSDSDSAAGFDSNWKN